MDKPQKAKVLFLDVERAPSLGWAWGKWEQDVLDFKTDWYFLSFAYKWQGEAKPHVRALPDYPTFKKNREDDFELCLELWELLDEADIVIAHNGDHADIPWARTRFLAHGMQPPSPFKSVDTRKVARRHFRFDSNKLDDLGRCLGLGRKLPNTGFELWSRCMAGEIKAFKEMSEYNIQDIILLEKVYLKLRSWTVDSDHPSVQPGHPEDCPKCGSSRIEKRGFTYTAFRKKQRYNCKSCGGWFTGSSVGLNKEIE
jgi:hypothetical protein